MEARVPWKDGYYGPAISAALGLKDTLEQPSPLRREGDELVCPGVSAETLAKVCASIDHAAARAAALADKPPTLESLQAKIDTLTAEVEALKTA